jgi:hypothetical protein
MDPDEINSSDIEFEPPPVDEFAYAGADVGARSRAQTDLEERIQAAEVCPWLKDDAVHQSHVVCIGSGLFSTQYSMPPPAFPTSTCGRWLIPFELQ